MLLQGKVAIVTGGNSGIGKSILLALGKDGAVATPINVETMQDPEKMAQLNAVIPLCRMAEPKEIADLVVWLASDESSYVTATTFIADGGMMQFSPGL